MAFLIVVALVAALAGGIASIAGFGIGSLLTPLVASQYGMKTAVGAVAILPGARLDDACPGGADDPPSGSGRESIARHEHRRAGRPARPGPTR